MQPSCPTWENRTDKTRVAGAAPQQRRWPNPINSLYPYHFIGSGSQEQGEPDSRLRDDPERFLALAFAGADLLLEATDDGSVTFAAGLFVSRFGFEPESLLGRPAASIVAPADTAAFEACLVLLTHRGRIGPVVIRLADASRTCYAVSGMTRRGLGGVTKLCLSFARPANTSDAKASTSCHAAMFMREAEQSLRAGHSAPAVRSPALDLFEIKKSRGELPRADVTAAILDQAGAGSIAGELGPGRFALLHADGVSGVSELSELVAGVQKALDGRRVVARVASAKRLSLGEDGGELSTLQAVRALRYALSAFAQGGAPALTDFRDGLRDVVTAATSYTARLRQLIADRRFVLAFQSIVGLENRQLHHYEALIRPGKAAGIPQRPAEFVSFVEMAGLAEELDWAVFKSAREAASHARVPAAFNMSGLSVQNAAFRAQLLTALDRQPAEITARLMVELTETAEIEDEAAAAETIDAIRQRGVPVCIDDFGAGPSPFPRRSRQDRRQLHPRGRGERARPGICGGHGGSFSCRWRRHDRGADRD